MPEFTCQFEQPFIGLHAAVAKKAFSRTDEFDQGLRAALCSAYFGHEDDRQLARMNLFALMSDVGWTLWGAIQAKISAVDFDFRGYYNMRWERATEVLDSDRLAGWMTQAQA